VGSAHSPAHGAGRESTTTVGAGDPRPPRAGGSRRAGGPPSRPERSADAER
jgi:hypothetical protein